jgi:diaminobutyrate-2-oxoglutarate transaminase
MSDMAHLWLDSQVGSTNAEYLERQDRRESNARTYARKLRIVVAKAQGMMVQDVEGRVYFDCLAGAGALALGHNHPMVVAALRRALDDGLPFQTLDLMTPLKDAFTEALFSTLPPEFATRSRIQFCGPAGTDAVEAAIKLVKTATGKNSLLTFNGGYHGMSQGALALMGNLSPKADLSGLIPGAQFLPSCLSLSLRGGWRGNGASKRRLDSLLFGRSGEWCRTCRNDRRTGSGRRGRHPGA